MTSPALEQLRDIHLPPAPELWPPAPLGWLAGGLTLAAAAWLIRRHLRRRPLRAALRELAALAAQHAASPDPVRLARGVSQLLRRYALWRFPHARAAGLTGAAWLRFLDTHGGAGAFADGPGALLATLPYRPCADPAAQAIDAAPLIALARGWLRANAP